MDRPDGLAAVARGLQARIDALPEAEHARSVFMGTYLRTTLAVGDTLRRGGFEDPAWVERWDVVFADLFLDAHDADIAGRRADVSRPWALAFAASRPQVGDLDAGGHPLLLLLLGINAHVNYDLPQSLLGVISDEEFADPQMLERRRRDHERIDAVLTARVAAEDGEITAGHTKALRDRLLTPVNRRASARFLREARRKVWHNTLELQRARLAGPDAYRTRLWELEVLSAAKINDLLAPGQVLLRLAVAGFGVTLPPAVPLVPAVPAAPAMIGPLSRRPG